jgi:hypothetical protein
LAFLIEIIRILPSLKEVVKLLRTHAKNQGFIAAVHSNNLNQVEALLDRGANVHANDDEALRLAAMNKIVISN